MSVIHNLVQFYVELHHLAFWINMKRLTEPNWDVKKGYSVFSLVIGKSLIFLRDTCMALAQSNPDPRA